jgi:hypothetical protein
MATPLRGNSLFVVFPAALSVTATVFVGSFVMAAHMEMGAAVTPVREWSEVGCERNEEASKEASKQIIVDHA